MAQHHPKNSTSRYGGKILFNITTEDRARLADERSALAINQSEYVRRAVRFFNAHCRLERIKREMEQAEAEQSGNDKMGDN